MNNCLDLCKLNSLECIAEYFFLRKSIALLNVTDRMTHVQCALKIFRKSIIYLTYQKSMNNCLYLCKLNNLKVVI